MNTTACGNNLFTGRSCFFEGHHVEYTIYRLYMRAPHVFRG